MKTLVTGGTGFLGSAVVRQLLSAGHDVRTLVRPGSDRSNLKELPVECCEGDLRDRGSLERALPDCAAVFHVAADYRLWIPDPDALYASNVEGTRNLLMAAASAGVQRIVYTSSVATLGLHPDGSQSDETAPVSLDDMIGHYKRSKYLAEEAVRELIATEDLTVIIVNPSTPIGPRDIKPTPTGRMIQDAALGKMPAYVDTGLNIVHVDDVAQGHLLAYQNGRPGERYILGGENLTLRYILEQIAELTGQPGPRVRLPHAAVMPIAYLSELWARLSGGPEPRATVDGVRMSRKMMFFSSVKAETELGYKHRPAQQALADAVEWFLSR